MKILLTIALYGVLAGLIATQPRADDIDIYRAGQGGGAGPTRVMFAVDLRAEAADILCDDAVAASCKSTLGGELYAGLDLFGVSANGAGELVADRSADGMADTVQADPAGMAGSIAEGYWAGVKVDRYDVLRAALRVVLSELSAGLRGASLDRRVEVGLMALHGDDCAGAGPLFSPNYSAIPVTGCSQGAYVLQGFTDISDPANLDQLLLAFAALPDPARRAPWMAAQWGGHPYNIRDIYLELYRYLTGQPVFNGFLGTSDYGSRSSGNLYHSQRGNVTNDVLLTLSDGTADQPLLAPATDIMLPSSLDLDGNQVSNALYISPIGPQETCASVAMVNLQFGTASLSHPDTNAAIAAPLAAGGLGLTLVAGEAGDRALVASLVTSGPGDGNAGSATMVPVHSYFLALDVNASSELMALAGGTGRAYSLAEPHRMVEVLEAVFGDVSGESRTLVAGSMLVNDPGLNRFGRDIYFSLFQPEVSLFWPGNIKKLKIVPLAETNSETAGMAGREIIAQAPLTHPPTPAISAEDGQILHDALTFWTDPTGADVLAFDAHRQEVSGRDGRSVTRGGAGQQVTGFLVNTIGASNSEQGARQMFTLDPDEPGELLALDASQATLAGVSPYLDPAGRMTEAEKLALIRWIRGQDSFDADGDDDRVESRRWLLGDALHSRPLAISYGARPGTAYSVGNPDVRIFFGTNDGLFHSLQNNSVSGAESGRETWAFIPPELLGMQSQLAHNRISTLQSYRYGLDGEAVSLIKDRDGDGNIEIDEGDSVQVFIGQRRGGRAILAFDMTDPDSPRYMWTINNRTPGFDQLALTFSTPRVARLDLGEAAPTPVLVFAGGYNGGWAGSERIGKDVGADSDLIGNAVYVVNPADGSLIWRAVGPDGGAAPDSNEHLNFVANLTDSIPSPVTVIDSDHNGVDDRAYVGDSGGNVWRIELTEYEHRAPDSIVTDASNWHLTRLASVGGSGDADRRFFHAPDVVQSRDGTGEYDGVVIVSGNRAAPRDAQVRNFAYLLKDRRTVGSGNDAASSPAPAIGHDALADITGTCTSGAASACIAVDLLPGWKLELQSSGEKGLSTPLVINGRVLFTSYVPFSEEGVKENSLDVCNTSEGFGRVYGVNLRNGSPALPLSGKLKRLGEEADRFASIGPGLPGEVLPYGDHVLIPGAGLEGNVLVSVPGRTRWRAYWREEEVDTL